MEAARGARLPPSRDWSGRAPPVGSNREAVSWSPFYFFSSQAFQKLKYVDERKSPRNSLRTTDSVEKAFIDQNNYQYLYHDGDHWIFMQPETFDQVSVPEDVVGDKAPYLTENMEVQMQSFEGRPISIEIPHRATFEIVETEPVVKGQTASGSFKPAMLSNGVKTMVPTHITTGTRVVVMTEDGAYVERAKD